MPVRLLCAVKISIPKSKIYDFVEPHKSSVFSFSPTSSIVICTLRCAFFSKKYLLFLYGVLIFQSVEECESRRIVVRNREYPLFFSVWFINRVEKYFFRNF